MKIITAIIAQSENYDNSFVELPSARANRFPSFSRDVQRKTSLPKLPTSLKEVRFDFLIRCGQCSAKNAL